MGGLAKGGGRAHRHVSPHKFTVYVERDGADISAVQHVSRVTYSIAPAAQQVVGQGVLWLQLNGFIQMVLQGQKDTEEDLRETALCFNLICPALTTHKSFKNNGKWL